MKKKDSAKETRKETKEELKNETKEELKNKINRLPTIKGNHSKHHYSNFMTEEKNG
tara:strand:- start:598 stop:765 length:168 start_codon:yes stop_codon:yes gene_type:complete